MTDNSDKTPLGRSLNELATTRALGEIYRTGQGLPCHVKAVQVGGPNCAVVTVAFDITSTVFTLPMVDMPVFGPEYIRYPLQVGDRGMAVSADAYLGGTTGMGGGTADLTRRANLSTLMFMPMGHVDWSNVDPNAVTVYGPNGAVVRDTGNTARVTITPKTIDVHSDDSITEKALGRILIQAGTELILQDGHHTTSPSGMNAAWAALISWINGHTHTNGNAGANTGAPVTGFSGSNIAP